MWFPHFSENEWYWRQWLRRRRGANGHQETGVWIFSPWWANFKFKCAIAQFVHNFCTWIALDKDKADWQELSAKVTSAPEHFSRILHHITSTSTLLLLMKTVKGTRHVEHGVCHNAGMRHQGNCDCMAKMGKNAPRKIKVPRNVEAHWENWHGQ